MTAHTMRGANECGTKLPSHFWKARSLKSDHTLLLTDADMHTQQREHTA